MNGPSPAPGHQTAGLAPRPAIDPVVLALVAAAADQVWSRPALPRFEEAADPFAWRFSGRWWNRPAAARRERPWARG